VTVTSSRPTTTVPSTTEEPAGGWVTALVVAVIGALLASAGLVSRAHRRRGLDWMKAHVTVAPRPGPGASFETQPGDHVNRDHVLTVTPVEDKRSTTVEEDN